MRRRRSLILALAALAVAAPLMYAAYPSRRTVRYSIRPVGLNLGWASAAVDINNAGDILGDADGIPPGGAVFIDRGGTITRIPVPGNAVHAMAMNERGDALCGNTVPDMHTYLWHNGSLAEMRIPGARRVRPICIADDGAVCGSVVLRGSTVPFHDFVLRNGKVTPIGFRAIALAPDGTVVGIQTTRRATGYAFLPCLWHAGRTRMLPLPPGYKDGSAYAINDRGQIAGAVNYNRLGDGKDHACLWDNGRYIDLGTLGGNTVAMTLNNRGQAVGYGEVRGKARFAPGAFPHLRYMVDFQWPRHAALFENGKARDLNDLIPADSGWTLLNARAINDAGQIVGQGNYKGRLRGFLLTPLR